MMTLGVIPVAIPYSDGAANHMYGDDLPMTDAEYAAFMTLYSQSYPPTPTSPDPEMIDAEYAAFMNLYMQSYPPTP